MLKYQDFVPRQIVNKQKGLFSSTTTTEHETFEEAVGAANAWIAANGIEVVNVETVVLPNVWAEHEQGSKDGSLFASGSGSTWHQLVRVWYRQS